jgi:hypothetical protein
MRRCVVAVILSMAMVCGLAVQIGLSSPASAAVKPVQCEPCFSVHDSPIAYPGTAFQFTVSVTGVPAPKITVKRRYLPHGLQFQDNHNGTGTVFGTPTSTKHKSVVGLYNPGFVAVSTGVKPKVAVYAVFSIIVCSPTAPQQPCPGS